MSRLFTDFGSLHDTFWYHEPSLQKKPFRSVLAEGHLVSRLEVMVSSPIGSYLLPLGVGSGKPRVIGTDCNVLGVYWTTIPNNPTEGFSCLVLLLGSLWHLEDT